ncbi:IclR family transcriptional regulator [Actinocorallia herbida]|uniref:IclR family transcriptional regulator n=1 Tax=Actinocorallia herbida TaxID=58109 RepID=A0A3N1D6A3_9ACTN|nr:helix-turn-helix domain-containing protein [Actinocorallia herbida]ROO89062.1 IclR family transcriptional regulator [Actinocorallia herbida]
MTTPPKDSAAARVLTLLEHVADGGGTANLSDLARATGLNRITAMRLVADLEDLGVLERTGSDHRLGSRLLRLAASALSGQDLTSLGQRALDALSTTLGVSAYLVVANETHLTYLLRSIPDTPLVSHIGIGTVVPLDATTGGRAIAAARTGDNACTWSHSGYEPGIDSVAAPVVPAPGSPVAAISLAAPAGVLDPTPARRTEVEQALRTAAYDLAALLTTTRS